MAWLPPLLFRGKSRERPVVRWPTQPSPVDVLPGPAVPGAAGLFQFLLGRGFKDLAGRGIDLVCPPRCVFCRTDATGGGQAIVCSDCRRLLTCDLVRCSLCGAPAPDAGSCPSCRGRWRAWDGIVVLGGYTDDLRQAVLAAKRPSGELVVAGLATLLWDKHQATLSAWRLDLVVPVPMHWTRRAARGLSAAQELARRLAASLSVPCRVPLRRIRSTRMQNELPPEERRANVRGVFRSSTAVAGRRVLLVDDVTTTGATLAECREALTAAGAKAVHAAVVARADRSGSEID